MINLFLNLDVASRVTFAKLAALKHESLITSSIIIFLQADRLLRCIARLISIIRDNSRFPSLPIWGSDGVDDNYRKLRYSYIITGISAQNFIMDRELRFRLTHLTICTIMDILCKGSSIERSSRDSQTHPLFSDCILTYLSGFRVARVLSEATATCNNFSFEYILRTTCVGDERIRILSSWHGTKCYIL